MLESWVITMITLSEWLYVAVLVSQFFVQCAVAHMAVTFSQSPDMAVMGVITDDHRMITPMITIFIPIPLVNLVCDHVIMPF